VAPVTDEDLASEKARQFEEAVQREVETLRIREAARREFARQQRDEAAFPELLTLEQRLALPREEIRHRIEGWFPVNARIILAAQFKAGKTTLVGNLVRSLADGRRFLGTAEVTPPEGTIVVLNFEDSPNQLDTWYEDLCIQHPERVVLVPMRGKAGAFDILQADVRRLWAEQLRSVECGFLCLDPIGPIMEAMGLDENHEAGKLLSAVNALLDEAGVPEAFLAHHMGHAGERSRGDSRLRGWPDAEWRLVRQSDDPNSERFISAFGRDVDIPETRLHYDDETRQVTMSEGNRRDHKAEEALEEVLSALEGGPLSQRAIERALEEGLHARNIIRDAIRLGKLRGLIATRPRKGRGGGDDYYITHAPGCKCAKCAETALAHYGSAPSAYIDTHALPTRFEAEVRQASEEYRRACTEPGCIGTQTKTIAGMWVCDLDPQWHRS
jgi:RecA-family ATPase